MYGVPLGDGEKDHDCTWSLDQKLWRSHPASHIIIIFYLVPRMNQQSASRVDYAYWEAVPLYP
jgi:hypothetical protein